MSLSRRPSISIHDYPEHLNPFNEDIKSTQPSHYRDEKPKDPKHKFWTFGRSRKKRSNSFSIKSTWNVLFGKRKEDKSEAQEKRSTITTVSTTYKRESYTKPVVQPHITKDQEDFNEALNTLARRRKYTLDNSSSRYSSSLTVNGDPARLYDGSPKETTTSIMGDLTPKPPARRFGQVSPKPTDKIPALDYETREAVENGSVTLREKPQERTPVPPLRRFGNRSSQKTNVGTLDSEEETNRSGDVTVCDENENVAGDYTFKRFSQDAIRKSNISINSCISVGSTMSSHGRKKRRAPQPPRRMENVETNEKVPEAPNIELQILEPTDIARVTENIDDLTKKSKDLDETEEPKEKSLVSVKPQPPEETKTEDPSIKIVKNTSTEILSEVKNSPEKETRTKTLIINEEKKDEIVEEQNKEIIKDKSISEESTKDEKDVEVEYRRASQENIEIIKDLDQELDDVALRKKGSSGSLSRSSSFSVKEEIEKIEKQIKALESSNASRNSSMDEKSFQENTRLSILENRRHFFQNMVRNDEDALKIEFKEFPRMQKDIHVVRLSESPVPTPREPVKVIELHISEPIRQKAELLEEVNPIPKPRRHSALNLNNSPPDGTPRDDRRSFQPTRGRSV